MQTQAFLSFLDAQSAQWNFAAKQDAYMVDRLNDQIKAQKLLSRNWVCLYPDFVGFPSAPDAWIANTLFNRNHADLLTVRGA